jgi:hypothetical protein
MGCLTRPAILRIQRNKIIEIKEQRRRSFSAHQTLRWLDCRLDITEQGSRGLSASVSLPQLAWEPYRACPSGILDDGLSRNFRFDTCICVRALLDSNQLPDAGFFACSPQFYIFSTFMGVTCIPHHMGNESTKSSSPCQDLIGLVSIFLSLFAPNLS